MAAGSPTQASSKHVDTDDVKTSVSVGAESILVPAAKENATCVKSCLAAVSLMQAASKPADNANDGGQSHASTAECKATALLAAMSVKAGWWLHNATNAEIEAMLKAG